MSSYSYSQVSTYNSCKGKHQLQYEEKIFPIFTTNQNLNIGSCVHAGLAAAMRSYWEDQNSDLPTEIRHENAKAHAHTAMQFWYANNLPDSSLTLVDPIMGVSAVADDFMEEWEAGFELAEQLTYRTLDHLNLPDNYEVLTINDAPVVEFRLEAVLPDGQKFAGYIDVVLKDKVTGLIHVVDWKTKTQFIDESDLEFDSQMPLYLWALYQYDIVADYILMYQILKKLPKVPTTNKNHQMSKANITTDWETYEAAVIENALLDPLLSKVDKRDIEALRHAIRYEAYADMWDKLAEYEFFRPLRRAIPMTVANLYATNFQRTVRDIEGSTERPFVWNTFSCRGCQYRQFCSAIMQGSDPNNLIGTAYKKEN